MKIIQSYDINKEKYDRLTAKMAENPTLLLKLRHPPIVHNYWVFEWEKAIFVPKEVKVIIMRNQGTGLSAVKIAQSYGLKSKDYKIIDSDLELKQYQSKRFFFIGYRFKYPKIIIY